MIFVYVIAGLTMFLFIGYIWGHENGVQEERERTRKTLGKFYKDVFEQQQQEKEDDEDKPWYQRNADYWKEQ